MAEEIVKSDLELLIKIANLVERCQTLKLITPEERKSYFERINAKAHVAIEKLFP